MREPADGRPAVERAMRHLVRLAREQDWSAPAAAARLVDAVGTDPIVLRRLRARLLRPAETPSGTFALRALATIEAALARPSG